MELQEAEALARGKSKKQVQDLLHKLECEMNATGMAVPEIAA